MAVALDVLGAGFSFRTVCAVDGDRLVVIGDGDPGLGDPKLCQARGEDVTSVFQRWADLLRAKGITDLPGGLVIDASIFDDVLVHPTWEKDDLQKWYAAPVAGLNFNDNCVDITIRPAEQADAPVLWSVSPPNDLVRIVNNCTSGGSRNPVLHHPYDTFEYRISGQCSKRWPFVSVSFPDPGLLFASALRLAFAERGVSIGPKVVREPVRSPDGNNPGWGATVPPGGVSVRHGGRTLPVAPVFLADHRTPIADVFARTGKDSQNLFAECLLKRSGYQWSRRNGSSHSVGTWETGARAVVETLQRAGIDVTGLVVVDGSGLSRQNRCTARQLVDTLVWMHRRADGALLRRSLAIAGTDGSLRQAMADLKGKVSAKTGTMKGVRALAGYVCGAGFQQVDKTGSKPVPHLYAFAIVFNGYPGSSGPYKQIQHRFCQILCKEL